VSKHVNLLVGTAKGLFRFQSNADRQDWKMSGPFLPGWEVYSVLGHKNGTERIFAGTHHQSGGATIQVSDDFGSSWAPVARGPKYTTPWQGMDPKVPGFSLNRFWQLSPGHSSEPETLYAGAEEAGLFVSRDGGENWEEVSGLSKHPTRPHWGPGAGGMGLHTILVHPDNPLRIWVAISAVGVLRTDDGGENWNLCNDGLARVPTDAPFPEIGHCAHKVALDPHDPDVLYMQDHGGVNKSVNGADSWFAIEQGLGQEGDERFGFPIAISKTGDLYLVPLKNSEQRVMRGGRLVIYRSEDRGENWSPVSGDFLPTTQYVNVLRDGLAVDDLDPYGVYFGTSAGELFYSLDRGDSWSCIPGRFPRINCVKVWLQDE
jgi:hypothetical protein